MRSTVEGLLQAPLRIESIAQIKTLLPDLIRFTYVDKDTLAALDVLSATTSSKKHNHPDVYGPHVSRPDLTVSEVEEVLLFQFLDGQLKMAQRNAKKLPRQRVQTSKTQSSAAATTNQMIPEKLIPKDLLLPTYSPKMMIKMVEKRNTKFREAVEELLDACAAEDPPEDPTELLIESACRNVPRKLQTRSSLNSSDDLPKAERTIELHTSSAIPTIQSVLNELKSTPHYRGQIVENGERVTPSRPACFQDLEVSELSPRIRQTLESTKGITRLYSHQARAIDLLSEGSSLIVTTSTSSGKSLIYQIPMLRVLEIDQDACGLYIFPTKALAQDQKQSLNQLILNYGEPLSSKVRIETYDGDTTLDDRAEIRKRANVIFTNPDMLHSSILPNEESWRRFFERLKFVVVDELHIYADLFGSHVAMIMRRLRRVAEALGNPNVQFISCSATIKNPVQHMKRIFGLDRVELISEDGAPSGAKYHIVWNPPLIDNLEPGQGRISSMLETSRIFRFLIERNIRTIVFCRTRKTCELLFRQVQEDLSEIRRSDLKSRIRSYRSGYTTQQRRLIESEMFNGKCVGIVATTALELGIDIGGLDAVITLGFPHSLSGLVQQSGRAGRRNKESLAMLILEPRGLDQHYASHPEELFDSQGSSITLEDLENDHLLVPHLHCSAHEIPLLPSLDSKFFGERLSSLCQENLKVDQHGFYHSNQTNPSTLISIRGLMSNHHNPPDSGAEGGHYTIIDLTDFDRPKILEEIPSDRVLLECFEGSIYLNQGESFQVLDIDHRLYSVHVRSVYVNYFTRPLMLIDLIPIKSLAQQSILSDSCSPPSHFIFLGQIKITTTITGYLKVDNKNHKKILDRIELPYENSQIGLPNRKLNGLGGHHNSLSKSTNGVWIDIPFKLIESLVLILKSHEDESERTAAEGGVDLDDRLTRSSQPRHDNYYERINLMVHLIEHLIIFVGSGRVPDDDPDGPGEGEAANDDQSGSHDLGIIQPSRTHHDRYHPSRDLRANCHVVNRLTFLNSPRVSLAHPGRNRNPKSAPSHTRSEPSHETFKLVDRIMIYEDPKRRTDYESLGLSDGLELTTTRTALVDLFRNVRSVLTELLGFLDTCGCAHGCGSCIFRPICQHLIFPDHRSNLETWGRAFKFCISVLINDLLDRVWVPE